jgi:hypothetical protein
MALQGGRFLIRADRMILSSSVKPRSSHRPDAAVRQHEFENKTGELAQKLIWLDRTVIDRVRSLRGLGETFSDVNR